MHHSKEECNTGLVTAAFHLTLQMAKWECNTCWSIAAFYLTVQMTKSECNKFSHCCLLLDRTDD